MTRRRLAALALCACSLPPPSSAHEPGEEQLTTAPVLVEKHDPVYPEAARAAGLGGVVSLEITVSVEGAVGEVKVVRPAGQGFDEAAVAAARRFKFRPATDHGQPVAAVVRFDQSFVVRSHLSAEVAAESPPPEPPPAAPPTRYETTVEGFGARASASSTTVRNADFDLEPRTAPGDLLRVVPGLLAVQHQGGGKADQLFLRGFDADHGTDVGLFIDGVPINLPSHAHGQGYADLHWLIPEALERVDVVKGPYDVRWGDFSTAGAVNLVTRERFDESSVAVSIGGFPTRDGRLLTTERVVGIASPRFTGWAERVHPWIAFEAARDDGPFLRGEGLQRYSGLGKLSIDLSPESSVGVLVQAYGSGWLGSGQLPSREVDAGRLDRFGSLDPSEGGLTERQMVVGYFHHSDPTHDFDASVYYVRYRLSLWNDFTLFLRDPQRGDEIEQDDARSVTGANLAYHFHTRWRGVRLRTTMGLQVRYDAIHVDLWDATSQDGAFRKRLGRHADGGRFHFGNDDDIDQVDVAAFAEEDVAFTRWLRAVAGVRADWFGFSVADRGEALSPTEPATSGVAQRGLISPKASLVATPLPHLLDLYLNFGMGFHSNDARIAVQQGRVTPEGSVVNTVPRLYGGEVGARFTFRDRVAVAAAFWVSYLENETVFSGDAGVFVPSDPTRRIGFDLEVRVKLLPWLHLDYDLAQASSTALPASGGGGAVALAPKLYMTGGLTVSHPAGVRAGLRFRYLADRPAFDEASAEYRALAASDPRRVTAEGWFVVDLYAAYRWRFLELGLSVQNLFDSAWREAQFGNRSCTRAETSDAANPNFAACGAGLPAAQRTGVVDVHFTPGVPLNLQGTLKAYF